MESISSQERLKLPEIKTWQEPFWQPFHVVDGPGETRPLDDSARLADIVAVLPDDADAFIVGVRTEVQSTVEGRISVQHVASTNGMIYVPRGRCEFADLAELEKFNPAMADMMLHHGLATALKVPNGYLAYDPQFITIIDTDL